MADNIIIGEFCSTAEKDTIILPKEIPGYITPEGQILKEEGQKFNFVYTPIKYNIDYNLDGGSFEDSEYIKKSYTVEDIDYIPPVPTKENFAFNSWEPKEIKHGTIGDITFVATWKPLAILLTGTELNEKFKKLAGNLDNIIAIGITDFDYDPSVDYINISSTNTPIYAYFNSGIIYLSSSDSIYCNDDMSHAFENMRFLYNIDCFSSIICKENTNINSLFKNCNSLSDVQSLTHWAHDGKFKDFTDAFLNTSALNSNRLPSWYVWNVNIVYASSTGKVFKDIHVDKHPGEVVIPESFEGYKANTESITITDKDSIYTFVYEPKEYFIRYLLDGATLPFAKDSYTIEDEDYYPGKPVKDGYTFNNWEPEYIPSGSTGNFNFIANFTQNT